MMKIRSKFWLIDDDGKAIFGEGRRRILEHINEFGSMQAAAKQLGMSYRGVWARIKATEERIGVKLVETAVGRGKNRGSWLTPEARSLLKNYKLLTSKGIDMSDRMFEEIFEEGGAPRKPDQASVLAVVGPKGSGKMEYIAKLTAELTARGRKIGVIRLDSGPNPPAAESRPYLDAGALSVIDSSEDGLYLHFQDLSDLTAEIVAANYASGCELVLVETDHRVHLPGIEIYRKDLGDQLITRKAKYLLAVIGDTPEQDKNRPVYPIDDLTAAADLIEEKMLMPAGDSNQVTLKVNGRKVPMVPFVQDFFDKGLTGMVSSLKSCQDPVEIEITIKKRTKESH